MTPAKKTSFADDETVDSSVVEDSQEFDADLTAALNRQPIFYLQDEMLAVHGTSHEEQVARELGTFSDREDETENETDRLLVEKTKLNWKYCNKVLFLKQVIAMEMWRPDNRTNSNWDLLCDALQVKGPPGEFAALNRKKAWDYLTLIAKEYRSNRYKRFAPSGGNGDWSELRALLFDYCTAEDEVKKEQQAALGMKRKHEEQQVRKGVVLRDSSLKGKPVIPPEFDFNSPPAKDDKKLPLIPVAEVNTLKCRPVLVCRYSGEIPC